MSELAVLFEKDPLQMTQQDIQDIVRKMREHRAAFEMGLRSPVVEKKPKKPTNNLLKELGL